jgi:hypothetical protein
MKRGMNKEFKINGIKLLIKKNYGVSPDLFDFESIIDNSLTMSENWFEIKPKVLTLCTKPHKILF